MCNVIGLLRAEGRAVALAGNVLGYGLAGAVISLLLEFAVATKMNWKVGDVPSWTVWLAPGFAFVIGVCIARLGARNNVAQYSALVVGVVQSIACVGYFWTKQSDPDNFIGELVMAAIVFWFGVFSVALATGGACGLAGTALIHRSTST
jgi:hypothetical protein